MLQSPSTFTSGAISFRFTATATGGVTGFTPSASGLPNDHVIADVLVNPTDIPQDVTYTITPVSPTGCADGPPVTVVVTVNPTPRIFPVPGASIQCDSTFTNITLQSPSIFTSGVVTFKYTAVATGGVTGFTPSATGLPNNHVITDNLVNPTDVPQTVTYRVVPVSGVACNDGPAVDISCDGQSDTKDLPCAAEYNTMRQHRNKYQASEPEYLYQRSGDIQVHGNGYGRINGFTATANGLPNDYVITDDLINPTDGPLAVTYRVVPVSPIGCHTDLQCVHGDRQSYTEGTSRFRGLDTVRQYIHEYTLQSPSIFTGGVVHSSTQQ